MALIDATDRFAQRREDARRQNGEFGNHDHTGPELSLVSDDTPTLSEVFDELNELGELDDTLDTPIVDTYTGTPEERAATERRLVLADLLRRAGLDRDALPEKTVAEIQDGILREQQSRQAQAEYRQRMLPDDDGVQLLPDPRTPAEAEVRQAVTAIIEARGHTLAEYSQNSREYLEQWAGEQQRNGTLAESAAVEAERSAFEREQRDSEDRIAQNLTLGAATDEVWEDALGEDRARAEQHIRRLRPNNYVPLKETNALMRTDLKTAFPGAKFSVRGQSYAGGASTDVTYVDGPPEQQVERVSKSFAGATFDGMTDMKSYHSAADFDADGVPVSTHYAADFVFTRRDFSDSVTQEAHNLLVAAYAAEGVSFDPAERNTQRLIPSALRARLGEASADSGYRFRTGYEKYPSELVHIASTLIADERWNAAAK